jgi:hypothetical protein
MRVITLTGGFKAIVDDSDWVVLSKYRWKTLNANGLLYAARTVGRTGKVVLMHRAITNAKKDEVVDHKNNNGLDNRKKNLRRCTQSQNLGNMRKTRGRSRYKGVYWNKARNKWQVAVGSKGKRIYAGRFEREDDAALAYNILAKKMFGGFAKLNKIGRDNKTSFVHKGRTVVVERRRHPDTTEGVWNNVDAPYRPKKPPGFATLGDAVNAKTLSKNKSRRE